MKANRNIHGKKFFFAFVISLLFLGAIFLSVGTTYGKYIKEINLKLSGDIDYNTLSNFVAEDSTKPGGGPEIFDETPTTVYQVQPGDTLATIAEKFNTTVEALIAYNNLEAPYEIEVGMILRIHPVDYVVPEMGTGEPRESESGEPADETPTPP